MTFALVKSSTWSDGLWLGSMLNEPAVLTKQGVYRASPDGVSLTTHILDNLPHSSHAFYIENIDLVGQWPDRAWLSVISLGNGSHHYRWRAPTWKENTTPARIVGVSSWTRGSLLALRIVGHGATETASFSILSEGAGLAVPSPPILVGRALCGENVGPFAFAAVATGEIVVASQDCSKETSRHPGRLPTLITLQRWKAGSQIPEIDLLPELGDVRTLERARRLEGELYARSAMDIYLVVNVTRAASSHDPFPYLAHFDGTHWSRIPVATRAPLSSVSGLPDGTVYLAAFDYEGGCDDDFGTGHAACPRGELWRRSPDGRLEVVALPRLGNDDDSQLVPIRVRAYPPNDVWVLASTRTRQALVVVRSVPAR